MNSPSRTSQAVALTRVGLDRPHSAEGDPDAQRKLCEDMQFSAPDWLLPSIEARTRFVDDQVIRAIASGTRQIVICGAGYDDRALRFRTAGARFFELDHPLTQSDKARLLRAIAVDAGPLEAPAGPVGGAAAGGAASGGAASGWVTDRADLGEQFEAALRARAERPVEGVTVISAGLTLVETDFRSDDVGAVLRRAGHEASLPTLFVCEGLLVYLDRAICRALLAGLAGRAAAGSVLVVSMATHADGLDSGEVANAANARRRTAVAEPWQTMLPVAEHLALVEQAGWTVTTTQWSPVPDTDVTHGRRTLLATAEPRPAE